MRLAILAGMFWLSVCPTLAAESVSVMVVNGAIGPATASYVSHAVDEAASNNSQCLVIELNTPGGLLDSMQQIVQKLLGAPVPVVVYVAPTGATAASAGCFITLAADVAAMAPATTIGAAHPVSLGGISGGEGEKPDPTMTKKLENFAVSYIQAIAAKRNRNVQWAETAVRDSASITADKARDLKVIEIIASNMNDLLQQLDGRIVHGKPLRTAGAHLIDIKMSVAEATFQALWRPEVMFLLLLVALYGIVGEVTTPGAILPGVAGAIALLLALYMAAILPVNITGLLLVAVAAALFIIDVFAPTHGVLTGGGIIAFLIGSLMLFDPRDPVFRLSLKYIIPGVVLTAAFFIFVVGKGVRAQRLPVKVGQETMIGKTGSALTDIDSAGGKILFEGEYWSATSDVPVRTGQTVQINGIEGLTLRVQPKT
ncbi:MAG: nodulation protein NfeD [Verrucomicrobia bacterium]|nr:nodulation protein NfeD [Verrucomicrobiota bacterium]